MIKSFMHKLISATTSTGAAVAAVVYTACMSSSSGPLIGKRIMVLFGSLGYAICNLGTFLSI
jgi:hypothetical protein